MKSAREMHSCATTSQYRDEGGYLICGHVPGVSDWSRGQLSRYHKNAVVSGLFIGPDQTIGRLLADVVIYSKENGQFMGRRGIGNYFPSADL